jgi:hypothetical protein
MTRPFAKLLISFAILGLALLVVALMFSLKSPEPSSAAFPNPNGYDTFIKAASMVTGDSSKSDDMNEQDLRALVKRNAESLALMRSGFSNDCRVRLDYTGTNAEYIQQLGSIKGLARATAAEGKLAELENRPADAAKSYSDVIRLACESSRGGRIIESLVSIALESLGTSRLGKLVPALEPDKCRELALALETSDNLRDPPEALLLQEREWARRAYGLKGQISSILNWRTLKQSQQKLLAKLQAQQLQTRMLMVDLAARAYESDKGQRPKSVNDLVPGYLKSIPLDPVTGTNLMYRPALVYLPR